jgi:phenolic acid decarboxylase
MPCGYRPPSAMHAIRMHRIIRHVAIEHFPIGQVMDVTYPAFKVSLTLRSSTRMTFRIEEGPFARIETVAIKVIPLGNGMFAVSWQETDGATVTNIQDL